MTDPQGGVTTYTYEAGAQSVQVSRPNGTRTHATSDAHQRLTHLVHRHADGRMLASSTSTLDASGNPVQVVEHTGRTVTYTLEVRHVTAYCLKNLKGPPLQDIAGEVV